MAAPGSGSWRAGGLPGARGPVSPYRWTRSEGNLAVTGLAERKETTAHRPGDEAAKRMMDIVLSLALIIIAAPLLLLLGILVRSTSAGPALFRQDRLGRDKQPFTMLKLRTMQ